MVVGKVFILKSFEVLLSEVGEKVVFLFSIFSLKYLGFYAFKPGLYLTVIFGAGELTISFWTFIKVFIYGWLYLDGLLRKCVSTYSILFQASNFEDPLDSFLIISLEGSETFI